MSRDLHILCEAHNVKSDELGHADRVLVVSRQLIEGRKELMELFDKAHETFDIDLHDIFDRTIRASIAFFREHSECQLGLVDEYGKSYAISDDPNECYAVLNHKKRFQINLIKQEFMDIGIQMPCQKDQADGHKNHIHVNTDSRGVEYTVTWNAWKGKGEWNVSHGMSGA